MHLTLCRTRANGTPGNQVRGILRGYRVEELASRRQAHVGDVQKDLASNVQAFVDTEAIVHVGVVDKTLPSNGGTGLFEVDAHDNEEVISGFVGVFFEEPGVFHAGFDVVDGARSESASICALFGESQWHTPDNDHDSVIIATENILSGLASFGNGFDGFGSAAKYE